ncbi:PstS family phosphate ABC transporter substrate-binding protein [Bacteroidales bacterium OttesenSCG-928-B11]|nr:PstS family phosphate ABC transporter substrate-binding protein [Bacteroidales bacterium OttesenSCG-928-E04]MDL2311259.1 PstS family phosphate ABC transporter substrate-binding protein [Bacteroidales bacterium OttesenSCG-928-B11]
MKKRLLVLITLASIVLAMTGCGPKTKKNKDGLDGEITISGAFALYPLVVKWAEEFNKIHPDVKIDISAGGAGKGMTDALSSMADLGMVSRDIYPSEVEKGAVAFAVAKDAVVPTINADNPVMNDILKIGLSREGAISLWLGNNVKTWEQLLGTSGNTSLHLYTRSDACGAAETWGAWFGAKQEDLEGTAVYGDPGLAQAIQKDKLGIGYNNLSYAYDEKSRKLNPGLSIIPLDVNGNGQIDPEEFFYDTKDEIVAAIADGRYPSPPARELFLVSKGVPEKAEVRAFMEFVMTKGQEFNIPVGYINLPQETLEKGLEMLK